MNNRPHIYANLGQDEYEEHFSNFIIDNWSYSKVNTFSRNEKVFEKEYVYRQKSKYSAATIAGQAYHAALEQYFLSLREGVETDIVALEQIAFEHIEETPANFWKIQKTTPTIEECIKVATKTASSLLQNFLSEIRVYTDHIGEILFVEQKETQWLKINGVDIPIPCNGIMDLVFRHKDGRIIITDHKSRKSFTDQKDASLVVGKQAITYASIYEAKTGIYPDEVWIIENKYSKNRDGSSQLIPIEIKLDHDTRRLYEAMLYEPLKRMIEAISDPDYVYMINDNDSFVDKAELFEFWMQTMIAEVEDFNIPEHKKEMIENRLRKIRDSSLKTVSPKIIKNFKQNAAQFINYDLSNKDMTPSEKIEHVLRSFGKPVEIEHQFDGYSSDTYLLNVSAGITISSIYKHHKDIANALNAGAVRMGKNLFIYNSKSYLAIEAPKVRTKDLLFDPKYLSGKKIPIGIDNFGQIIYWDLNNHSTPHILIGGATGSGKSVCVTSTIEYAKLAGISDIIIFDPKYEFLKYKQEGVQVVNELEEIEYELSFLVAEMQERAKTGQSSKKLVVIDEFADVVASSSKGDAEKYLRMLAQKGRSLGYRIVAATQRASVKVITGDAKVNFPVQICFRVPKEVDSKVMIDEPGAESLAGLGDGLIKSPEYLDTVRFQGFYKPN